MMFPLFAALAVQAAPAPDLDDPFNRAVADWAACTRYQVEIAALASNRRDIGVVDEAMQRCLDEESEVRALVGESVEAEATMRLIRERFREAMHRHLRRQRRR